MIKVLKPGLATSVQDLGREGFYHLGIPPSGALDQYALRAANHLVGNQAGAAGIECALVGPELEFQHDALVAVCGAQMPVLLDGREQHPYTAFAVRAGQVLRFGFPTAGARAYLAVAGGIDVPEVLGSRSTYALGALGGHQGRKLGALSFQPREQPFGAGSDPSNIVDSCYPIGSIQVPAGLEPIILHRDAVSGGGYAMIGTVISADLDLVGQMQPNQQARFLPVSMDEALEARRSYKKKLGCLAKLFG